MPWPEVGGHGALHALILLVCNMCQGHRVNFLISVQFEKTKICRYLLWSCQDSLILILLMSGKGKSWPWLSCRSSFLFCPHLTVSWSQTISFSEAAFGSLSNENVYLCSCLLSFRRFEWEDVLVAGHPGMQQCLSSCMKPISDLEQWKKN